MELKSRIENNIAVVQIIGRLSAEHAEQLRTAFFDLFKKHRKFAFDLSEMEYLDSTGLGMIIFCLKSCREVNGSLHLAGLQEKPRMIFEITKANRIFNIHDQLAGAVCAAEQE